MPVKFDYKFHMDEIRVEFEKAGKNAFKVEERIVLRMSEAVAAAVRKRLGRDTGPRAGHTYRVHMADDVDVSRARKKDGDLVRVIGGGWATGLLWHLVEYGTLRNERRGKHFIERSLEDTEDETDRIFEEEIKKGLGIE